MPKINIRPDNIEHHGDDTVALSNPILRNMLVQKPDAAFDWLSSRVGPVDPAEISIDDNGRVLISNAAFAKVLSDRVAAKTGNDPAVAGDTACSNGSC